MAASPIPILFIDHTARLGGGELALLNLLTHLDRTRFEPTVLLFANGPLHERLVQQGIATRVLPLHASVADARKDALGDDLLRTLRMAARSAMFVWQVRRAIRASGARLVHCNSLKSDLLGGVAARLAGVKVIWHVRDRVADDYLPPKVVRRFRGVARWLPTALIANSQATLDTLGPSGDPPRVGHRPAWVVHDGTTVPPFVPPGDRVDNVVIGLVGRVAPWKGQDVFIDAAARVRRRFPQARFRIVGVPLFGEEAYARRLTMMVESLGLTGSFEFAGFRDDVDRAMAELDVLVHASTTGEPFGQVIIEGMAAGRAVVATRGGGVPEIVRDEDTGLLVPMNDAPALAAAIERLLADPVERRAMGARGRQRVIDAFTIQRTAAGVGDVFDRVLAK